MNGEILGALLTTKLPINQNQSAKLLKKHSLYDELDEIELVISIYL